MLPNSPVSDKKALRAQLKRERQTMADRPERAAQLQQVLRVWLVARRERTIGAYWPIKGEFDPLPALYRWSEADPSRRIGLPVMNRETCQLRFHVWHPGCPMEDDAFGIPKPTHGTSSSSGSNASVSFGLGMPKASSSIGQPGCHT